MDSQQNFGPVKQGDTFRVDFSLFDADGAPLLLTDLASAAVTFRWSRQSGGIEIGEVPATLIDIGAGAAAAQILVPTSNAGFYFHELKMTVSGDMSTMATGTFLIDQQFAEAAP